MCSAIRVTPAWIPARDASDTERIVPVSRAVSGMTLLVDPAWIWAIVTTTGSNTSIWRVTSVCSAVTISHAIGIGSSA